MARIAVGGFHHETNTFAPVKARYENFELPDAWPGLTRGPDILEVFSGLNIPLAGFLAAMQGHDIVPLQWCSAGPSAHVEEDAYERIVAGLLKDLSVRAPYDAVYLCLHGAMVTDHLEDGEGELLRRVRAVIGETPLIVSLDLHANVTEAMIEGADAMICYRTYPHIDMAETGARAAALVETILSSGQKPAKAFRKLPFLIPLSWQCTMEEPAKGIYEAVAKPHSDELIAVSFAQGFPAADIQECGPTVFAYGTDHAATEAAADALFALVGHAEPEFAGELWDPAEAVTHAADVAKSASRPVILADTQDNPGGGANSDTVGILRELVRQAVDGATLGLLNDPAAAAAAHKAGEGAEIDLALGEMSGLPGHTPFEARVRVEALSDGVFEATGPFYGGSRMQLGKMALLRIAGDAGGVGAGVQVVVSSRKQQAADQAMFTHLGVDPAAQNILVLKSSVHFRAHFQPIAEKVLVVGAPGPNIDDPVELPYENLRPGVRLRPLGPVNTG